MRKRGYLLSASTTLIEICLDTILPRRKEEKEILKMLPQDLSSHMKHSFDSPHPEIHPLFQYHRSCTRTSIHLLKYKGNKYISDLFGALLHERIISLIYEKKEIPHSTSPLILPIPMSKERCAERGYNQTELLCDSIALHDKEKLLSFSYKTLIKQKDTKQQTTLKRKERVRNIKGSLAVSNQDIVIGKDIIVIDDVTTTGSTLLEAREVLLNAGARKVICLVVAH